MPALTSPAFRAGSDWTGTGVLHEEAVYIDSVPANHDTPPANRQPCFLTGDWHDPLPIPESSTRYLVQTLSPWSVGECARALPQLSQPKPV